jgi:hypothetical protein
MRPARRHSDVNARAAAATLATSYVLAVGVWLLAQTHLTLGAGRPVEDVALQGLRALLLVQLVAVVLGAPLFVAAAHLRTAALALGFVVLAGLPLVTLIALMTATPPAVLAIAEGGVLAAALAAAALAWLATRIARRSQLRTLALGLLQLGTLALCWRFYLVLLAWLGL